MGITRASRFVAFGTSGWRTKRRSSADMGPKLLPGASTGCRTSPGRLAAVSTREGLSERVAALRGVGVQQGTVWGGIEWKKLEKLKSSKATTRWNHKAHREGNRKRRFKNSG